MIRIRETIVVEGKDDEAAVLRAADANVITTSGYGLSEETIRMIRTAYERTGIVIFTDPDHAGRSIRSHLTALFPNAKQAYLTASEARKKNDLGIENASPEAIIRALTAAIGQKGTESPEDEKNARESLSDRPVTLSDLDRLGLAGGPGASSRREKAGAALGIGYGNAKTFLRRLNRLGIGCEELADVLNGSCKSNY